MRQEITNWWKQANEDLDTAKENLKIKKYYVSVFFCQQAVEKSLKAYCLLIYRKNEHTHNVFALGKHLKIPVKFDFFLRKITPEYIITRYPDITDEIPSERYDENIAKEFIMKTEELLKWLKNQMKK